MTKKILFKPLMKKHMMKIILLLKLLNHQKLNLGLHMMEFKIVLLNVLKNILLIKKIIIKKAIKQKKD